jgi:hypothetical protein
MLPAVVPAEKTWVILIGSMVPAGTPMKLTSSPDNILTESALRRRHRAPG